MFKGKVQGKQIGELYEALVLTADSENTVRLFALSAAISKMKEQASFFDLVCEVRLNQSIVIKAVDFYTNFNTILVTTENDTIKIGHNLKIVNQADLDVHLPAKVLSQVNFSIVFEIGQTEYRACGLQNGDVSLLDGDDLKEWGESLIKIFSPMTSLRTSKSILTDATTSQAAIEEQGKLKRAMSLKTKTIMVPQSVETESVTTVSYIKTLQSLAFGSKDGFFSIV